MKKKKRSNKILLQNQPNTVTAEATHRPAIKRDCYCRQVMKNGNTDIKVHEIGLTFLYHSALLLHSHQNWTGIRHNAEPCLICLIIKCIKEAQENCFSVYNLPKTGIFNTLQNYLLYNISLSQIFQSNIMSCSKLLNNLLFTYISHHIQ